MWEILLQGHVLSTVKICSARYVTRRKYFSQPRSVMYSFATLPIKLKLVHQIGGGLLIANHMDESLWWANQKQGPALKSYLLHSFLQVHSATAPRTSHAIMLSQNDFPESNRYRLGFFHPFVLCTITYWAPLEML
jgi:hypothetical protein